ncbi:hypothetical protein BOW50_11345, partial [Solemya velum gill symbiont]|uniref:hypothetical protein n=1 Tax=Solemya velum gill symbiont TaxID=2340 RepID=UPI0009D4E764
MNKKRTELLEYVRIIHERLDSRSSKAGMTNWAIIAGLIYVSWHLLNSLPSIPITDKNTLNLFMVFSNMHLALLALSYLVSSSGFERQKKELDYRFLSNQSAPVSSLIFLTLLLLLPFYCLHEIRQNNQESIFIQTQFFINYWALAFALLMILINLLYFRVSIAKNKLPHVAHIVPKDSTLSKVLHIVSLVLIIEILIGNTYLIVADLNADVGLSSAYITALDISLILFGLLILTTKGRSDQLAPDRSFSFGHHFSEVNAINFVHECH